MQNWKSTTSEYTPIIKESTKDLARHAIYLRSIGISIDSIAIMLDRSKSRVYEYLRRPNLALRKAQTRQWHV